MEPIMFGDLAAKNAGMSLADFEYLQRSPASRPVRAKRARRRQRNRPMS